MLFIGIDLGTSGCRASAIDSNNQITAFASVELPPPIRSDSGVVEQDPLIWWRATQAVLTKLLTQIDATSVCAIAVDGTSATTLLIDHHGTPLGPALMYDDSRAIQQAQRIFELCPSSGTLASATSSLAKFLWLREHYADQVNVRVLHQADWIAAKLAGQFELRSNDYRFKSDYNNCLKLGYDSHKKQWPAWFSQLNIPLSCLPEVYQPGTVIGTLGSQVSHLLGLPPGVKLTAGTTDSTASFLASGANQSADAVTTLGSTMVLKVITNSPVDNKDYGVYSQPLFDQWLVGGASNSGGSVLKAFFTLDQIEGFSQQLQPDRPTGLDYYPLLGQGERFPVNDPSLAPRLLPRPDDDVVFFQGILEGFAKIEKIGYDRLTTLGAPYPSRVITMGGGAKNKAWNRIRQNALGVPVSTAEINEAAYGSALLAKRHTEIIDAIP